MAEERLNVILSLVTGNFKKEAKEAANSTSQITGSANTASDALKRFVGPAAIGAAITGLAAMAFKAGENADRLFDLSAQTGVSTDKLQEYEHVAKIAGASTEVFSDAVKVVIKNLNETEGATGTAAKAYDTLGISVFDSSGKLRDAGAITDEVLTKLGAMDDITARNALTQDIFGKKWEETATILDLGADGLERAKDEAHDLGVVIGQEALKKADAFRESVNKLKAGLQGMANEGLAVAIPLLQGLADEAQDAVGPLGAMLGVLDAGIETVLGSADATSQARDAADEYSSILDILIPGLTNSFGQWVPLNEQIQENKKRTEDAARVALFMASAQKDDLIPAIVDTIAAGEDLGSLFGNLPGKIKKVTDAYGGLTSALLASTDPVFAAVSAMQRLAEVQKDPEASSLDLAEAVIQAQSALSDLAGGNVSQAIGIIADALGTTNDAARDLLESAGLLKDLDDIVINVLLRYDAEGTPLPPAGVKLAPGVVAAINAAFPSTQTRFGGAFDQGGVVRARRGEPVLAIVHGGETIFPTHKMPLPEFDSGGIVGGISQSLIRQGGLPAGWNRPNVSINVNTPMDDFRTDLMYATVMATVTTMVEAVA